MVAALLYFTYIKDLDRFDCDAITPPFSLIILLLLLFAPRNMSDPHSWTRGTCENHTTCESDGTVASVTVTHVNWTRESDKAPFSS